MLHKGNERVWNTTSCGREELLVSTTVHQASCRSQKSATGKPYLCNVVLLSILISLCSLCRPRAAEKIAPKTWPKFPKVRCIVWDFRSRE
jgi:hypothetical protein